MGQPSLNSLTPNPITITTPKITHSRRLNPRSERAGRLFPPKAVEDDDGHCEDGSRSRASASESGLVNLEVIGGAGEGAGVMAIVEEERGLLKDVRCLRGGGDKDGILRVSDEADDWGTMVRGGAAKGLHVSFAEMMTSIMLIGAEKTYTTGMRPKESTKVKPALQYHSDAPACGDSYTVRVETGWTPHLRRYGQMNATEVIHKQ